MSKSCDPRGCDQFFGPRFARHLARRYRRHGLDKTAQRIVDFLEQHGLEGASVLEIGGGVGEIQIELLKRGATHAMNLELVDAYDTEARRLLHTAGLQHLVERRRHDIAADPDGVEPADAVVLHRVVCCYPDYQRLLAAAADHTRRILVFSYPPHNPAGRAVMAAQNAIFRVLRRSFRTFNHPPDAMLAVLAEHGLRATYAHRGLGWQVAGLERATTAQRPRDHHGRAARGAAGPSPDHVRAGPAPRASNSTLGTAESRFSRRTTGAQSEGTTRNTTSPTLYRVASYRLTSWPASGAGSRLP